MKLHLTFNENDFNSMRLFERAVKRQCGENCYVGTNSLQVYFDYPKELIAMLRPCPTTKQLEFDLESSLPDAK
jgi:hypothetical protein